MQGLRGKTWLGDLRTWAERFGLKMFRCQTHFPSALQGVNIVRNYNGSTKGILNWMLIKGMRMINTTVRKLLSTDEKTETLFN